MVLGAGMASDVAGGPGAEKPGQQSKAKRAVVLAAVVLLLILGAYVTGRLQTAAKIDDAESRADQAKDGQQQQASKAQSAEAVVLRLECRRRLHLALVAMDDRNFGIAQEHLSEAGALLGKAEAPADSEIGKLGAAIRGHQLVATEDVGAQRSKVLGWVRTFDEAVPPLKAK